MLLTIPKVLSARKLARVRTTLEDARFVDGKLSAGTLAGRVKRNQELDAKTPQLDSLNQIVIGSLWENHAFQRAALPHRVSGAFFARYGRGMRYGEHNDDAVMGRPGGYRCDIAITVFLSDADSYEGGELVVTTSFGDKRVKLPAGDAVIYPASSLHQVTEITHGMRLVAVAWAQSLVRDPGKRELLYELDTAREALIAVSPEAQVTAKVDQVYGNLLRMWAEL